MDIVKRLPFDVCENCGEFVLDVSSQTMWYGDGGSHLLLTVRCKNAEKCKRLRKNLNRMGDVNAVKA